MRLVVLLNLYAMYYWREFSPNRPGQLPHSIACFFLPVENHCSRCWRLIFKLQFLVPHIENLSKK